MTDERSSLGWSRLIVGTPAILIARVWAAKFQESAYHEYACDHSWLR